MCVIWVDGDGGEWVCGRMFSCVYVSVSVCVCLCILLGVFFIHMAWLVICRSTVSNLCGVYFAGVSYMAPANSYSLTQTHTNTHERTHTHTNAHTHTHNHSAALSASEHLHLHLPTDFVGSGP